jgi:hypothetical protein
MSELTPAQQHGDLTTLHDDVIRRGDPLDAMRPLFVSTEFRLNAGAQAGVALWMGAVETPSLHYLATYPLYALGGMALARAGTVASNKRSQRQSREREGLQEAVRQELGEPVDLFRTGGVSRKTGNQTVLRWYGADGLDLTEDPTATPLLVRRLSRLLDKVEASPVDTIALPTNWLTGQEKPLDPRAYGVVVPGEDFVASLHKARDERKRTRLEVVDLSSAEDILYTGTAGCRTILADLREQTSASFHTYLLDCIAKGDPQSKVPALYSQLAAVSGEDNPESHLLKRHLQAEIERALLVAIAPEPLAEKDELGVVHKVKTHTSLTVRGTAVSALDSYYDHTGQGIVRHQGSQDLLGYLKLGSQQALVEKLQSLDAGSEAAMLAKTALLLDMDPDTEFDSAQKPLLNGADELETGETLLESAQIDTPWNRGKKPKKGQETAPISLEYIHSQKPSVRIVSKVGAMAIAVGVPLLFGTVLNRSADRVYYERVEDSKALYGVPYYQNDALKERFLADRPWGERYVMTVLAEMSTAHEAAQSAMLRGMDTVGLQDMRNKLGLVNWSDYTLPPPEADYTQKDDLHTGDVEQDENTPVYTITPFNGASTAGYWAASVDNTLDLSVSGSYPFTNNSLSFREGYSFDCQDEECYVGAILPTTPTNMDSVLYEVTTPYYGNAGAHGLPLTEGTSVVAAQLSYPNAQGEQVIMQPNITYLPKSHTYRTHYPVDTPPDAPDVVTLTYWLGPSQTSVNATGELMVPDLADMPAVHAATKAALGLPADAPESAVSAAIRSKNYSFTPFLDADVPPISTPYRGVRDAPTSTLATIGETMATIPATNCNVAASTYILANGGTFDGQNANPVSGFRNGSQDNVLSTMEAHAWLVNESGDILDNTPASSATLPPLKAENTDESNALAAVAAGSAGLLALAGVSTLLYKKRRRIAQRVERARDNAVLRGKHTPRALSALQYANYTSGEQPRHFGAGTPDEPWVQSAEAQPTVSRVGAIPDGMSYKEASELMQARGVTLDRRVRRALRTLLGRHPNLVKRPTEAQLEPAQN